MSATVFDGVRLNDTDYLAWIHAHPHGFVVNRYSAGASTGYLVLHRASCGTIRTPRSDEPGEFTERDYAKVCAESVEALRAYVRTMGRADGSFSKVCKRCKPDA